MQIKSVSKILIALSAICISACTMQLRDVSHLPPALHKMQFSAPDTIGIELTDNIRQQFKAMGINWTKDKSSPSFNILSDQISYTNSNVLDSNIPSTYVFTEVTTFSISYQGKLIFGPSTISRSTTITMNQQALYAGGQTDIIRKQLHNSIITGLYYMLTANDTKQAVTRSYISARKK
jgi:outer membrane lipopolysaccharide assembly protein LptE/RlpB